MTAPRIPMTVPQAAISAEEVERLLKKLHLPWGSSVRNTSTIGPRPSAGEFHHAAVVKDGDTAFAIVELLNALPALLSLAKQAGEMRKALEFYADRDMDGYDVDVRDYGLSTREGRIIQDRGKIARAALSEPGAEGAV